MNQSNAKMSDAVFGNSAALDAILASYDFAADSSWEDVLGSSDSPATHTESTLQKSAPAPEQ